METNEAIQILKEQLEGYVHNPIEKAISLAIKALESVSKADNGEVKSAEEILKKYGIIVCSCENCQSINETHIKATHEHHNQFPSVKQCGCMTHCNCSIVQNVDGKPVDASEHWSMIRYKDGTCRAYKNGELMEVDSVKSSLEFPSVKVGSGSVMSPNEIVNACKEELLKQLVLVSYPNNYPIKAVPQAAILELPTLMRSRMSNDKTE